MGGDFYDYFPIDEHRFGLVIADACGKGLPAAMLISQMQAMLKSEVKNDNSIEQTVKNLNEHLKTHTSENNFATLFYGIFDSRTGALEFTNAGHNYPILLRKDGKIEFLKTTSPALGLLPNITHKTEAANIGHGDCILFYTDGVTETMNSAGEEYGEQRLLELLIQICKYNAQDIIQHIIEDLNKFKTSDLTQDDRTLMVFKRNE